MGHINQPDTLNVWDECTTIIFGPCICDKEDYVSPFYATFNINDKMLHNYMFYSRASHNLMPRKIMEKLGLDITIPYHDLYSFNSIKFKCEGLIKDMVVTLA
jgi:hypothetical protein